MTTPQVVAETGRTVMNTVQKGVLDKLYRKGVPARLFVENGAALLDDADAALDSLEAEFDRLEVLWGDRPKVYGHALVGHSTAGDVLLARWTDGRPLLTWAEMFVERDRLTAKNRQRSVTVPETDGESQA
ncbi:MAG: hypothetical protein QGI09_04970 [Dehalococcoidia bacterium]|nr:hypothetical protein [Dehalococcoidia bacterium]